MFQPNMYGRVEIIQDKVEQTEDESEIIRDKTGHVEIIQEEKQINTALLKTNKPTISIISRNFLPSTELNLSQAMSIMMQNPNCSPLQTYIELWKFVKEEKNILKEKMTIKIDETLLPNLNLELSVAMNKIKQSSQCIPHDLYIKRWNELKNYKKYYNIV